MKRNKRGLKLLAREQMQGLTTKNLLAYFRRMHQCPENGDMPYVHKSCKEWKETYKVAKEILATREHIERKS